MTTGRSQGDEWRDAGGALRRGVKGQGLGAEEKVNQGGVLEEGRMDLVTGCVCGVKDAAEP